MSALGQKQTFAPQKVMSGTTRGIRGGHLAIMAGASSDPAAACGNATGELLEANGRHSAKPNPVTPAAEVLGQSGRLVHRTTCLAPRSISTLAGAARKSQPRGRGEKGSGHGPRITHHEISNPRHDRASCKRAGS